MDAKEAIAISVAVQEKAGSEESVQKLIAEAIKILDSEIETTAHLGLRQMELKLNSFHDIPDVDSLCYDAIK
jgi:hypothetical protein